MLFSNIPNNENKDVICTRKYKINLINYNLISSQ